MEKNEKILVTQLTKYYGLHNIRPQNEKKMKKMKNTPALERA